VKIPQDSVPSAVNSLVFIDRLNSYKIIKNDIKKKLENYLLFRHFIRHSYSSELDGNEMGPLIKDIEDVWKIIKFDFEAFIKNN
jgi:hypothetical protein